MGWKWSKPHTPSKPRCSANWALSMTSAKGIRCWAMSSPMRMDPTLASDGLAQLRVLAAERAPRGLPAGHDPRVHHERVAAVGLGSAPRRALRRGEVGTTDDRAATHAQPNVLMPRIVRAREPF